MLAGRTITWRDDKNAPKVAVVNREFARQVFGSITQAVGGYFKTECGTRIEVAGVVEDGKYKTLTEDPRPAFFLPILQSPATAAWLVVRSNGDPQQLAASVHDTLRGLDPGLPLTIMTWQKELDSALFAARTATISLGILGVLGAMLAVTGIFGMASYSVSKRLRELGIRVALGARSQRSIAGGPGKNVPAVGSRRSGRLAAGHGGHPGALLHCLSGLAAGPGGARRSTAPCFCLACWPLSVRPGGRWRLIPQSCCVNSDALEQFERKSLDAGKPDVHALLFTIWIWQPGV